MLREDADTLALPGNSDMPWRRVWCTSSNPTTIGPSIHPHQTHARHVPPMDTVP
jgi:hypothetical protein